MVARVRRAERARPDRPGHAATRLATRALAVALIGGVAIDASAITKLEGEYQIQIDARKEDRSNEWDFDSNNSDTYNGAQFRLFSAPATGVEAFVKFEADWNPGSNDQNRPMFQYRESHLRYRIDRTTRGADLYLFQRQDRFWVENHLIRVVEPNNLKDSDNAQGARLDLWGLGGTNMTLLSSDFSGQSNPGAGAEAFAPVSTDDAHVVRLRRPFLGNRLRLGMTYNRKVEAQASEPSNAFDLVAGDMRYQFGVTDLSLEFATRLGFQSEGDDGFDPGSASLKRLDPWLPDDLALVGELRALRVGHPTFGYYNLAPSFWYYGPEFVNPLGRLSSPLDDQRAQGEQGIWLNSWYLVPERAITLALNYTNYERFVFDRRKFTELYAEMYVEYVNGFTTKFYYSNRIDRNLSEPEFPDVTQNRDLFAEVQVESRLAWMRIQGKIKDFDSVDEKALASVESSVNLTPRLKVYGRYTFGNDPARLRKGLFTQLQYRPRGNMEAFLEYGPGWIGDTPNPVDDGDLAGSADNRNIVKLIVKGNF